MPNNQSRQPRQRLNGHKTQSPNNFTQKRKFNRDFIPTLAPKYYAKLYPHLKGKNGWQTVKCLFHEDNNPSLRVCLDHGGFKCFACNASGDLVKFHMMTQQKTFNETINDLGAWEDRS